MGLVVAIENEDKFANEIKENLKDLLRTLNHDLVVFKSYDHFLKEKSENKIQQEIKLIILNDETLKDKPVEIIEKTKKENSCEVIATLFSDPSKSHRKTGSWPVLNIIYKPFDLTILKEHILFALTPNQKVKSLFVHTAQTASEIESLRKFKILELTDFAMKVDKFNILTLNKPYKFYHPIFTHGPYQHVWGRVVAETDLHYEVLFIQLTNEILLNIRKKVNLCTTKNKKALWLGKKDNTNSKPNVMLYLDQQETSDSINELLTRHFSEINFLYKKDIKPQQKLSVDLLITDQSLDKKNIEQLFTHQPITIHIIDKLADRKMTENALQLENLRLLKPFDKSQLVRSIQMLFPKLIDIDPSPIVAGVLDVFCDQAFLMAVTEFSESAITFKQKTKLTPGLILEIALPQKDETQLTEMKAKVHYIDPKPDNEGLYSHQIVLFGMKDEFLKLIRLWELDAHIKTHQKD